MLTLLGDAHVGYRQATIMRMPPVRTWRWTRAEYDRMVEVGVLDEKVYREPVQSPTGRWSYRRVRLPRASASIVPLGAPKSRVRGADPLP